MAVDDLLKDLDSESEVEEEDAEDEVVEEEVKENGKDITSQSTLTTRIGPMLQQMADYMSRRINKTTEYEFLIRANDTSAEVTAEQSQIHDFIKKSYAKRFPELESLIPLPIDYVKVILVLQNSLDIDVERLSFLGKEKILVLTMSALQAQDASVPLTEPELRSVLKACHLMVELNDFKGRIEGYVASRLEVFAPNLTAIVGPYTAAQFMSIVGGLAELAKTPACNIAALGNKRTMSLGLGNHGTRQQGFLYYSELIQNVVTDLRKQAMRIAAGKLILAARVDYSNSIPDGSQGKKWKQEVLEKIEKLEEPPEVVATKALPVPNDLKAKKRGGRRYRKIKEKFEMSDLRKAQDRVVFGHQEKTITDAFGEEIGLGMLSSVSRLPTNSNNRAKMSKGMKNRLQNSSKEEIFNQDIINLPVPEEIDLPLQKKIKR
jgi:U4/U6 small nuclear ribonucleoprotein PRP31